jgi:hypothetical protein
MYLPPAGSAERPPAGLFISRREIMSIEPAVKRTIAFFDGQNLFHHSKEAFGYSFPNFDTQILAQSICSAQGWNLSEIHFYTGVPSSLDKPFWSHFWSAKLAVMGTRGIRTYLRLTGCRLGLLINFGENLLKDGFKRVVNGMEDF